MAFSSFLSLAIKISLGRGTISTFGVRDQFQFIRVLEAYLENRLRSAQQSLPAPENIGAGILVPKLAAPRTISSMVFSFSISMSTVEPVSAFLTFTLMGILIEF